MEPQDTSFIENLFKQYPQYFNPVLEQKDRLRIQVIYTKIDRDRNNIPHYTHHTYNLNKQQYFYPASTVKMPVAFLALEKLNKLNIKGVDKYTPIITDSSANMQTAVFTHPSAENSVPSVAHYIKQIFLVSDNDAFNRLYEFLGQEYIQQQLFKKGYANAEIRHRLSIILTQEQNRATNAVSFYDTSGRLLYQQPAQYSKVKFKDRSDYLGKGYKNGDELIEQPFNFSEKNKVHLQDLHEMLQSVIFPEAAGNQSSNLTTDDYQFLYRYMSGYPGEAKYPCYDSTVFYDAYTKFVLFGGGKESVPDYIRIFNKAGWAYGFLTDVAYVVDFKNKVEFLVSATIYCNRDEIFNDDQYDYETTGKPFFKHLGEALYNYELKRVKKYTPELSRLQINYAKD